MITLCHGESALTLDPALGNIPSWRVEGREALHAAPWRTEAVVQGDPVIPLVERRLAGDFFCMPFGRDDVAGDPPHGLTANSPWEVLAHGGAAAHLRLECPVRGASVEKHLRIAGPALYQTHVIAGGQGAVSFAHHPMTRMAAGGQLSVSPKRAVLTDAAPQEPGRNLWALDQTREDMALICRDGTTWDLRDYPAAHRVEDFCLLVEAEGARIGWTVLMRNAENDMLVVLKDATLMPVTMLWVSNGGRDHAPWSGRHSGVLGIEDGCAAGTGGLGQALGENRLTRMGVPTALRLGGRHVIRHAMLSLPRPMGWSEIAGITLSPDRLSLHEMGGQSLDIPFDGGFFG